MHEYDEYRELHDDAMPVHGEVDVDPEEQPSCRKHDEEMSEHDLASPSQRSLVTQPIALVHVLDERRLHGVGLPVHLWTASPELVPPSDEGDGPALEQPASAARMEGNTAKRRRRAKEARGG